MPPPDPLLLHAAFLGLVVGTEAFFTGLTGLNLRHGARRASDRAAWLRDVLGVDDPDRVVAYQRDRTRIGVAAGWTTLAVVLGLLYTGAFGGLVVWVEGLGSAPGVLGAVLGAGGLTGPVLRGVAFLVLFALLLAAVRLPFRWAGTFRVEERHGFNRQTPRGWLRDVALGTALMVVMTAAVAGGLLLLIGGLPTWWWLAAAALYVPVQVVLQVLLPRVVAPLFHDFTPLPEGPARDAAAEVVEAAGVPFEEFYVMDASRRTGHGNAFFVGFGRHRRAVLYDTFLDRATVPEVQAVLAHELAHWKRRHIWRGLAASAVGALVGLAALAWLMGQTWLYGMFGLAGPPAAVPYAGLVLAGIWLAPVGRWLAPLGAWMSRRHEREADDWAAELVGDAAPLADALVHLAGANLSNPFPHPLWAAFHASHPPLPERLARLGSERTSAGGPDEGGAVSGE